MNIKFTMEWIDVSIYSNILEQLYVINEDEEDDIDDAYNDLYEQYIGAL